MKPENVLQHRIHRALGGRDNCRLFRNNCGVAFAGEVKHETPAGITLTNHRRIRYGLTPGSSDLIGWVSKIITPDMVGKRVAVFLAVEIKTPSGRLSEPQEVFIEAVRKHGGIAGVARSVEEAKKLVNGREVD